MAHKMLHMGFAAITFGFLTATVDPYLQPKSVGGGSINSLLTMLRNMKINIKLYKLLVMAL